VIISAQLQGIAIINNASASLGLQKLEILANVVTIAQLVVLAMTSKNIFAKIVIKVIY